MKKQLSAVPVMRGPVLAMWAAGIAAASSINALFVSNYGCRPAGVFKPYWFGLEFALEFGALIVGAVIFSALFVFVQRVVLKVTMEIALRRLTLGAVAYLLLVVGYGALAALTAHPENCVI